MKRKIQTFLEKAAPTRNVDVHKDIILYLEDITVSFDGFKAIDSLNLYIKRNELRCIIGPNGAGKTTMMDIVTGKTKPDYGSAWFGQNFNLLQHSEDEIARAGIGRKFQKPTVFENLTVFDNLELAMDGDKGVFPTLFAKMSTAELESIDIVLEKISLSSKSNAFAGSLSHGQKQWLEIGMLLMQNSQLLLIDEPAAGMTHQEMDKTTELLQVLKKEHTIVVVEHDMDFVRSLESPVTVLHQGSVLAEGSMDQIQNNPKVVEVYLGE
ncbi:MAG: urea ABC transporter ATP-binding protein UrtD [Gammaproteobacteria bacterium]|nr:urea ABC transporter ATP-binding protein UrtD [Gammaproteobacteria bacterium]